MTVYNVTQMLSKEQQSALKKFLDVERVQVMFSDWTYDFGLRLRMAEPGYFVTQKRRHAAERWVTRKIGGVRTSKELRACPKALLRSQRKDGD